MGAREACPREVEGRHGFAGAPRAVRGGARSPPCWSNRAGAAVDDDLGAADPRRVVPGEEERAARDVLGLAHASERNAASRRRLALLAGDDVRGEAGPDRPGTDRVDAD